MYHCFTNSSRTTVSFEHVFTRLCFISVDMRDLISVDDVMEDKDLRLGPNGGLIFCME